MRKSNPLFVDSTKLTSDSVGCTLELSGVSLSEGESIYGKIIDSLGNEESTSLSEKQGGNYSGQMWLQHQQDVTIQFYVMGAQGILRQSKSYESQAQYVMEFEWKEEVKDQYAQKRALEKQKPAPSQTQIMDDFSELSSLIDKWGL